MYKRLSKTGAAAGAAILFILCTPSMGVISTVKVRNGGWQAPTISQEQGCPSRGGI